MVQYIIQSLTLNKLENLLNNIIKSTNSRLNHIVYQTTQKLPNTKLTIKLITSITPPVLYHHVSPVRCGTSTQVDTQLPTIQARILVCSPKHLSLYLNDMIMIINVLQ